MEAVLLLPMFYSTRTGHPIIIRVHESLHHDNLRAVLKKDGNFPSRWQNAAVDEENVPVENVPEERFPCGKISLWKDGTLQDETCPSRQMHHAHADKSPHSV